MSLEADLVRFEEERPGKFDYESGTYSFLMVDMRINSVLTDELLRLSQVDDAWRLSGEVSAVQQPEEHS